MSAWSGNGLKAPSRWPGPKTGSWFGLLALGGAVVAWAASWLAPAAPDFPLDDAWIHLDYAQGLIRDGTFAYNQGRPEAGFTSLRRRPGHPATGRAPGGSCWSRPPRGPRHGNTARNVTGSECGQLPCSDGCGSWRRTLGFATRSPGVRPVLQVGPGPGWHDSSGGCAQKDAPRRLATSSRPVATRSG